MAKKSKADKKPKRGGKSRSGKPDKRSAERTDRDLAAMAPARELFRLPRGSVDLSTLTSDRLEEGPKDKKAAQELMPAIGNRLSELQERLYAESVVGGTRRVLLILQGMDTSGKDGTVKHVFGMMNPGGVALTSFKKPTTEELSHDFLWRIEQRVPLPGYIGVFNRSQYEDVLVVRVHDIVPKEIWSKRYAAINRFERQLVRTGTTVIKCFLDISKKEQAQRLAARLDDPTKYWKFNPDDIDERAYWDDYREAYRVVLEKCSTVGSPWYVIPADRKWYRNWAIASILLETLEELNPQYPAATFDVEEQKQRLADETS